MLRQQAAFESWHLSLTRHYHSQEPAIADNFTVLHTLTNPPFNSIFLFHSNVFNKDALTSTEYYQTFNYCFNLYTLAFYTIIFCIIVNKKYMLQFVWFDGKSPDESYNEIKSVENMSPTETNKLKCTTNQMRF